MFPWDMILKSFGSFYVCLKLSLDLQKGALISFLNIRKNTRLGWLLECKLSFGKKYTDSEKEAHKRVMKLLEEILRPPLILFTHFHPE